MLLCLTPNPAIDRTLLLPSFAPGKIHRAEQVLVAAGGKGLNVARSIRTLGGEALCMGFTGRHSGKLLAELAQQEGLNASWTVNRSETRTCTILVSPNGDATVVNEPGLPVSRSSWKRLRRDVGREMSCAEIVCISGSLPPQSAAEDWRAPVRMLVQGGKQVWVDT